jgi:hypothetical protein
MNKKSVDFPVGDPNDTRMLLKVTSNLKVTELQNEYKRSFVDRGELFARDGKQLKIKLLNDDLEQGAIGASLADHFLMTIYGHHYRVREAQGEYMQF